MTNPVIVRKHVDPLAMIKPNSPSGHSVALSTLTSRTLLHVRVTPIQDIDRVTNLLAASALHESAAVVKSYLHILFELQQYINRSSSVPKTLFTTEPK